MNISTCLDTAVIEMNRRQSESLGDRSTYIGSSDISGCARKAFMQRKFPTPPSTSTLLKFSRGHAAEWMLNKFFEASGAQYDTQVELIHPDAPLKAHIDFLCYVLEGGQSELHAIEVKSVSGIPDEPYSQWEDQLSYQLGMLRVQYPNPKVKIGGSILAVDLNAGQIRQFNGYLDDDSVFNYLYCRGLHLLEALEGKVEACASPSLLCGFCQYREDCPAFDSKLVALPPEVEQLAKKYASLNGVKGAAEKEMKSIRQELVDFTGNRFRGRTDDLDLSVSYVESSSSVDTTLLKNQFPEIYPLVLKPRSGYTRLEVKEIKKKIELV